MAIVLGVLAFCGIALAVNAAPAEAGRLVVTGHDADDHCDPSDPEQCHFFKVAVDYARSGAPTPSGRVLLIDCSGSTESAMDGAYGPGSEPTRTSCPSDDPAAFNDINLTVKKFSAIVVGSSCDDSDSDGFGDDALNLTDDLPGGCGEPGGSTPDSDLINARKGDIKRFFNDGGGIVALAGDENGDGDPSNGPDVYYNFLPLDAQGVEVTPPFCLTARGIAVGFEDQDCPDPSKHSGTSDDINCCPTHNSFAEPEAGTPLKVAERDAENVAETLVADAKIKGGGFVDDDEDKQDPKVHTKGITRAGGGGGCVDEDFRLSVFVADESNLKQVRVELDGRKLESTKRNKFTIRVPARRLLAGPHTLTITARDSEGNSTTQRKQFRRCAREEPAFTG